MKVIRILLISFAALLAVTLLAAFIPKGEKATCSLEQPNFKGGVGYEIIDFVNREVWATTEFTPEEFEAFSFPVHWVLWRKNDPRMGWADSAQFLQSPGCNETGQYTYLHAFGKTFFKVVELDKMHRADEGGLIRRVELEKYHVLSYAAGRSVSILENPEGERFIGVARTSPPPAYAPTLPKGWRITSRSLTADLQVDLTGRVSVIRLDNEDSYQGPLPKDLPL